MAKVRLLDKSESRAGRRHQNHALELARRFPGLCASAKEAAASVMHGVHGRRRAGAGETFWQFRPFVAGEAANRIDWRVPPRTNGSMCASANGRRRIRFTSGSTAPPPCGLPPGWHYSRKSTAPSCSALRLLICFVRGGERAGLLGLTPAFAVRHIVERFAEVLLAQETTAGYVPEELPAR